jgi:outer membrane receptor for ferric coprogen and ferric-rhodotorulic acid
VEFKATDRIESRFGVRFSGPFTPIGEESVRTRAYAVADLGASITLSRHAILDVELQNIFDSKYPEIRASGFINPGAPRALRAAIRLPSNSL